MIVLRRSFVPLVFTTVLAMLVTTACMRPMMQFGPGSGLIGLVILVLDIVAIVQILQSAKQATEKLLWVILVLVLHVIGVVLWFVIGKKP